MSYDASLTGSTPMKRGRHEILSLPLKFVNPKITITNSWCILEVILSLVDEYFGEKRKKVFAQTSEPKEIREGERGVRGETLDTTATVLSPPVL